jgi:hypothetical protein
VADAVHVVTVERVVACWFFSFVVVIMVSVSSPIGRGGSSRVDSAKSSLVGEDLLEVSVWVVVSFLDSGSLFFGKATRSSIVLPVSSEKEESDE